MPETGNAATGKYPDPDHCKYQKLIYGIRCPALYNSVKFIPHYGYVPRSCVIQSRSVHDDCFVRKLPCIKLNSTENYTHMTITNLLVILLFKVTVMMC